MAWPTSVATNADLYVAVNNVNTTLNGAIDAVTTTVVLTDATNFPATGGFVTIGTEAISYTSKTGNSLNGVVRGADGTVAASHANLAPTFLFVVAAHHNELKDEVIAVETDINARIGVPGGTNTLKVVAGTAADPSIEFPSGNGIYDAGVGGVQISRLSAQVARFDSTILLINPVQLSDVLQMPIGSVTAPSIAQTSDLNTGLYWSATDVLSVTAGGSNVVSFKGTPAFQTIFNSSTGVGTRPSIAFSGSETTGFINSGTTINIMNSGSTNYTFSSSGVFQGNWGNSISSPAIQGIIDTNTGIAWSAADTLDLATAGLSRLKVTSAGQSQFSGDLNPQSTQTSKINNINSNTSLDNHYYVTVDASGGAITLTLPALSGITGRTYWVKKTDSSSNNVVIDGSGAETIDGAANVTFNTQYQSYTVVAGASEWHIF